MKTKTAATRVEYSVVESTLYLALELSSTKWKLAFTVGLGQSPRLRTLDAGDLPRLLEEIQRAKQRFGLPAEARVLSCYEAGRDGFWIHRFLQAHGVENHVVDASSIEVPRRKRRAKTDRLDATKLAILLVRYGLGERKSWSVVRVPSVAEEDRRHLHRELDTLKQQRTAQINRIKGLLATVGLRLKVGRKLAEELESVRLWDGSPLPEGLVFRLMGELERLEFLQGQIQDLEQERCEKLEHSTDAGTEKAHRLMQLKGIGATSAWLFAMELFGWRTFDNRKQLAALVGLAPVPYDSGQTRRDQGISKTGNPRLRATMIQLAWGWLRYQPRSQLSRWFEQRFATGGSRSRRVGIVAVARKLLIAMWRFVEQGVIPEGAVLSTR